MLAFFKRVRLPSVLQTHSMAKTLEERLSRVGWAEMPVLVTESYDAGVALLPQAPFLPKQPGPSACSRAAF